MHNEEKLIFNNQFGSVTDKRIIVNYKDGSEDIPISQISSVKYKHVRSYFFSLGGFAVAIAVLIFMFTFISKMKGEMVLVLVLLIIIGTLSGIANWIGHHEIVISVNGNNRKPIKAELSKTREGRNFVDAIRKAIAA